jgi:dimethylhistidine N-methyltransferase
MMGRGVQVIEYGSGSGLKTRLLLESLDQGTGCVLVDISRSHLMNCAEQLEQDFPDLEVSAVCADYTRPVALPDAPAGTLRKVVFFPGSTIGNFEPQQAENFLRAMAESVGAGGALLIGVDLQKPAEILEPAYDDSAGVTADFNLNLLRRINRDLGADFQLENFFHRAPYNADKGRVEMHLVSKCQQRVHLAGQSFQFNAGETIHTESSHKYTLDGFKHLAAAAGWTVIYVWIDDKNLFSVQYLVTGQISLAQ